MDLLEFVRRPMVDGVKLSLPGGGGEPLERGTVAITAFYLIYSTRRLEADEITVLHTAVERVEWKVGGSVAALLLKDFRRLLFEFSSAEDCQDMAEAIERLSKPDKLSQLHAFSYSPRAPLPASGWGERGGPHQQFAHWRCSAERWRVSSVNKDFKVCSSYPQEVIVPFSVSDEDIRVVAGYRHLQRFPVLCFHHGKTQAVLLRGGQPLCGPLHKRCKEDVALLNACLPSLSKGKVLDIRQPSTAQQHMSKGGGVELPSHYPQWKVEYGKLEPPPSLLASLNKLIEACTDASVASSSSWFGRVESSGWLSHISRLLSAARFVTLCLHKDGSSVLVHGAGSRDATLQVTSLAQIMLDSHCRTAEGFVGLVQREWLDGGHPFSLRHQHAGAAPEKEKAPVFLLFLDAVWQIMQQFPLSFEFNECFLHTLFVHSYHSVYGTFLYDTPRERIRNKLTERSHSLWDHLSQKAVLKPMLNALYEKNSTVLLITVTALNVTLWKRLYLRRGLEPGLLVPGQQAVRRLKETNTSLKRALTDIRSELLQLQTEGRKYASNWS